MSTVGKYFKENKKEVKESYSLNCCAYGCPLLGTISSAVDGKGKFYCRFHFGAKSSLFDKITAKIRQMGDVLDIFNMCLFPHQYFDGDQYRTYDEMADQAVKSSLEKLNLMKLYVENNIYQTSKKVSSYLNEFIVVKDNTLPEINPDILKTQWWNK